LLEAVGFEQGVGAAWADDHQLGEGDGGLRIGVFLWRRGGRRLCARLRVGAALQLVVPGELLSQAVTAQPQIRRVAVRLEDGGRGAELTEPAHLGALGLARGVWDAIDIDLLRRGQDLDLGFCGGRPAQRVAEKVLPELVGQVVHPRGDAHLDR
jgi:hypothetical protein